MPPLATFLAVLATIGLTFGCGGGDHESTDGPAMKQVRSTDGPDRQAAKRVRSADPADTPVSPVVPVRAPGFSLTPCPEAGPGGFDVRVAGISCEEGSDLLLGVNPTFAGYRKTQEILYRPSGDDVPAVPAAKGWTCWARYDKLSPTRPVGEIHVICWKDSDLLLFKIG